MYKLKSNLICIHKVISMQTGVFEIANCDIWNLMLIKLEMVLPLYLFYLAYL